MTMDRAVALSKQTSAYQTKMQSGMDLFFNKVMKNSNAR